MTAYQPGWLPGSTAVRMPQRPREPAEGFEHGAVQARNQSAARSAQGKVLEQENGETHSSNIKMGGQRHSVKAAQS